VERKVGERHVGDGKGEEKAIGMKGNQGRE